MDLSKYADAFSAFSHIVHADHSMALGLTNIIKGIHSYLVAELCGYNFPYPGANISLC